MKIPKKRQQLLASSGSSEGLCKLISEYWGGATVALHEDGGVANLNGAVVNYGWQNDKGRFRFFRILP